MLKMTENIIDKINESYTSKLVPDFKNFIYSVASTILLLCEDRMDSRKFYLLPEFLTFFMALASRCKRSTKKDFRIYTTADYDFLFMMKLLEDIGVEMIEKRRLLFKNKILVPLIIEQSKKRIQRLSGPITEEISQIKARELLPWKGEIRHSKFIPQTNNELSPMYMSSLFLDYIGIHHNSFLQRAYKNAVFDNKTYSRLNSSQRLIRSSIPNNP
jgi:DNA-binding transcriptional MerR regulator